MSEFAVDLLREVLAEILAGPLGEIQRAHLDLADRLDEVRRRMSNMHQPGPVAVVDAENHVVRLNLGSDESGADVLSPWVPYTQWAGEHKEHRVPSVGQQMMFHCPDGVLEHGYAVPHTWSNANPSPSKSGAEGVSTFGKTKRTWTKDGVKHEAGSSSVDVNDKAVVATKGGSKVQVAEGSIDQKSAKIRMNC